MKKFLVIGCGGSGGATLRYAMDQLRADLRVQGITELPPAWQFVHIDVNPSPEATPGLGNIRDLGGSYVSVSSPGNMYALVAGSVENRLVPKNSLRDLLGWAPLPKNEASAVNVVNGAGQYRAIGRMMTLNRLQEIQDELAKAWVRLQSTGQWADLPVKHSQGGPYDSDPHVIPIVIGSLAGGSGAAMFLDVCRLLGRLPGLTRSELGVFLYTSDVFSSLDASLRKGIDGNAMGAIGDLIAAQSRASDGVDSSLFEALGIPPETVDEPAFARVIPIGASIGGDGAKFGDGSMDGVYRGLGRALAATIGSHSGATYYVKSKIENPNPPTTDRNALGWGIDPAVFCWGSFGYASLSLGRDRYATYATQRMARSAADRLLRGHLSVQNKLPADEQLRERVTADWPLILERLGFPRAGADVRAWLLSARVLAPETVQAGARLAASAATQDVSVIPSSQATVFVDAVRSRLTNHQIEASSRIRSSAYAWAEGWASRLEEAAREEFLRAVTTVGLPYAREVVRLLRGHLSPFIETLRGVPPMDAQPLVLDQSILARAMQLKKSVVDGAHAIGQAITEGYVGSASRALERESGRLAAEVLASFASDVLGALERAATGALTDLEAAEKALGGEAGLAQLATSIYGEWPSENDIVPKRFDHADNEVLLTTSKDFPERFRQDVTSTVVDAGGIYDSALQKIVAGIVSGRWETTGGAAGDFRVLTTRAPWRSSALPTGAATNEPTPKQQPVYELASSPTHLLERARAYQQRPDQPFEQFSEQTFDDFLDDAPSESERAARLELFVQKFAEALRLARPLVGVSPAMIERVHPGERLTYEYAFGDIPLSPASPAAARMKQVLDTDSSISSASPALFQNALSANLRSSRIAIFGNYPKYSPLVFTSFLGQVQTQWASATEAARRSLWQWKRTRPLTGAVALGSDDLRLMITGWFLGRMLGLLVVPDDTKSSDPVQVFDLAEKSWRDFPVRLLSPRDRYRGKDDWLPGVIEGHTLALMNCNNDVQLTALQPYVALRRLIDDSLYTPTLAYDGTAADGLIEAWVASGYWPSGHPSQIGSMAKPHDTPQARVEAASTWLKAVRNYVATTYLTEGGGVGTLAARKARVESPALLETSTMFAEIAELAEGALGELEARVARAARDTAGPGGESGVERPDF